MLPGAMLRNESLKFRCHPTKIRVENVTTPFTLEYSKGEVIEIPIAHGEGNYYCDEATLANTSEQSDRVPLSGETRTVRG